MYLIKLPETFIFKLFCYILFIVKVYLIISTFIY
uniref:Uncharacterized protein n=1 Tax=Thuretia quercifolia TaxID=189650 RepID=A0A1Z1MKR9_9FLOR|nr:hypothetical protein [Thuretia quercifolia]ARW66334.1 hypothetical protein [Thuretia quercifolia]